MKFKVKKSNSNALNLIIPENVALTFLQNEFFFFWNGDNNLEEILKSTLTHTKFDEKTLHENSTEAKEHLLKSIQTFPNSF